jgi:hypothetical protein
MQSLHRRLLLAAGLGSAMLLASCGNPVFAGEGRWTGYSSSGRPVALTQTDTFQVIEHPRELFLQHTTEMMFCFTGTDPDGDGKFSLRGYPGVLARTVEGERLEFRIEGGLIERRDGELSVSMFGAMEGQKRPFTYRFGTGKAAAPAKGTQLRSPPDDYAFANTSENLAGLLAAIRLAHASGDSQRAGRLTASLVPDRDQIARAVRSEQVAEKIQAAFGPVPSVEQAAGMAKGLVPPAERTECRVHGATGAEIAGGAPAFPGGAKRIAQSHLRPDVTFYEVEYIEPGETMGTKFHLFYWDGTSWKTLGAVWRVLES